MDPFFVGEVFNKFITRRTTDQESRMQFIQAPLPTDWLTHEHIGKVNPSLLLNRRTNNKIHPSLLSESPLFPQTTFIVTIHLPITLRHTFQLILLLDRITVTAPLGRVNQLLGQALSYALDVAESRFTGANGQECDRLVDAAERGDVDGLAADGAGGADSGGVFAGTAVYDGVDGDLDWVLVGHDVNL